MQAADEFRDLLLKTYKNFLQAWRHFLDSDGSNRCSWVEFSTCCRKLNWNGDVCGAWRALDEDLSGYISLAEIDADASNTLGNFKAWADEEFGSVKSAFSVFDNDGSNEVTFREFRKACRTYGFPESVDIKSVFEALDVAKNHKLSSEEVMFLDDWDFPDEPKEDEEDESNVEPPQRDAYIVSDGDCTRYETDGPGPATYAFGPTIGAGPAVPRLRFSGAFTFRKKLPQQRLPGLSKDAELNPSPAHYDAARLSFAETARSSKPAWGFGSSPRMADPGLGGTGPGPGSYGMQIFLEGRHARSGPAATCSPRRPIRVHPLFRQGMSIDRPVTVGSQSLQGGPWSARLPSRQ